MLMPILEAAMVAIRGAAYGRLATAAVRHLPPALPAMALPVAASIRGAQVLVVVAARPR